MKKISDKLTDKEYLELRELMDKIDLIQDPKSSKINFSILNEEEKNRFLILMKKMGFIEDVDGSLRLFEDLNLN